jgi:glycosyltransferase involved in cell wall biosynthesis
VRVIVLGLRGLPNVEGGVETHAEQLYPRLAALGCDVEILVRTPFSRPDQPSFGAIRLHRLWSPRSQGVEAFVHSVLAVLYSGWARPDVLHVHAIGPALVTPLARLLGLRVVVTHHGPDYDRDKWGWFARAVLKLGERCGMRWSNARIAISPVIRDLVRARHQRECDVIPNGVPAAVVRTEDDQVRQLGLEPNRYFLQVGRMVPEKRQLDLLDAYRQVTGGNWKLAIAGRLGDDSYSREVRRRSEACGAVLTGFVQGDVLAQLYSHAGAFVLPSSHEGLPIALLEALSYGIPVLASNIPANVAVGLASGSYFPLGDTVSLARLMTDLVARTDTLPERAERRRWVADRFDWDQVAQQTLAVYKRVAKVSK